MTQRSDQYDVALLAAMAALTPDAGERERALRARLEGWREHPLCAPRAALPDRFWGPERLDPAAVAELAALLARDAELAALRRALEGVDDVVDVGGAGRAEAVPVGDGGADAAIACWTLQLTDDPIAAIDELERVARRRVAIVQAAPDNDLVAIYNRAAEVAGAPLAHHGWLLSHAATRLELAGFKVTLEPVPIPVRAPDGGALALAELFVRLHFAGHPSAEAMIAAIGGYIAARLAEAGALSNDAVLLVARR